MTAQSRCSARDPHWWLCPTARAAAPDRMASRKTPWGGRGRPSRCPRRPCGAWQRWCRPSRRSTQKVSTSRPQVSSRRRRAAVAGRSSPPGRSADRRRGSSRLGCATAARNRALLRGAGPESDERGFGPGPQQAIPPDELEQLPHQPPASPPPKGRREGHQVGRSGFARCRHGPRRAPLRVSASVVDPREAHPPRGRTTSQEVAPRLPGPHDGRIRRNEVRSPAGSTEGSRSGDRPFESPG